MFKQRRRPPTPYKGKPYSQGFGGRRKGFSFKIFYQILICLAIFLFAITLNKTEDPLGERVVAGIQYFLSTESDVQPVIQRVVGLGLQLQNVDWPLITNFSRKDSEPTVGVITEQRQAFKIPVSGKIIRKFGAQEETSGYQGFHEGIDIQAELGKPIKAADKGVVESIGEDKVLGKFIIIKHGQETKTLYGQLGEVKVEKDQEVKKGQEIASVGESGIVDTPHLHFEVREHDELIDPLTKFDLDNKGI